MPSFTCPKKLRPLFEIKKRFKIVIGGRGSGKSMTIGDICLMDAQTKRIKTACFREYQNSIDDSVYALLVSEIKRLELKGFEIQNNRILLDGDEMFKFKGMARDPEAVKSMHGFKRFFVEEAQTISDDSLKALTPTLREEDSEIWMAGNPRSSEDPFSKRFINPFYDTLLSEKYYEDDLHLIIWVNHDDNPFFPPVLDKERQFDFVNKSRALYDHIWGGMFNDSVENGLVLAEWFDACIDAHKKLGFVSRGAKVAAHDPSDEGGDSKGYAMRHGSIVLKVEEKLTGNVNEGGHWACSMANDDKVDAYSWDGDGMGIALTEQTSRAFDGTKVQMSVFRGSESPDFPDAVYEPTLNPMMDRKTNNDAFRNKRAQYYFELRDRIYRTYRAVEFKEYADPDKLISFSSDIMLLSKLRAELCRMPIKPNGNGLFELYTKEMMRTKFKINSPNLADSVMMLMRHIQRVQYANIPIPPPMTKMGIKASRYG